MNNKGRIAIGEIMLLLVGMIATVALIGNIPFISAEEVWYDQTGAAYDLSQSGVAQDLTMLQDNGVQLFSSKQRYDLWESAQTAGVDIPAQLVGGDSFIEAHPDLAAPYHVSNEEFDIDELLNENSDGVRGQSGGGDNKPQTEGTRGQTADKVPPTPPPAKADYYQVGDSVYELNPTSGKYELASGDAASGLTAGTDGSVSAADMGKAVAAGGAKAVEGNSWLSRATGATPGTWTDALASSIQYSIIAYTTVLTMGPLLGLDDDQTNAAAWGAVAATTTYQFVDMLAKESYAKYAGWWAALAFAIAYIIVYRDRSYRVVRFTCDPWQAPVDDQNCEACNEGPLPCSEYQCRSLGQNCRIVNPNTEEEKCAQLDDKDIKPPVLEPWLDGLTPGHIYTPDNAINPPDRGVQIISTETDDGCIKAFTPLKFGVTLNEIAKCRVDPLRKPTFNDMSVAMSQGLSRYNHSIQLSLPGQQNADAEGIVLQNDGDFELYIKCEDENGNSNEANFVFKYCVDKGPDTTAPKVVDTNVLNGKPVAFEQGSLELEVYMNEPADCRWSHSDESFDNMVEEMDCVDNINDGVELNARTVYVCSTELTGIQDRQENKYYFRCKDQPLLTGERSADRNVNSESYEYIVYGTQPLVIEYFAPNETTIKDSADAVKVTLEAKTIAGFNEGEATCFYAEEGDEDNYIEFFNTNSHTHSTDLYLPEDEYDYLIKCVDEGGNSDVVELSFETESDSEYPEIVRAYKDEGLLHVVSSETADCVYDTNNCNFLFIDGLPMTKEGDINHFAAWDTKTKYHIKCKDEYGNEPDPDECSAIVRPL